jgi:hypothetical protein
MSFVLKQKILSFNYTVKKRFASFPSPAGMSLTKLPLGRNNSVMTSFFPPRESLVVTSRLGTGNSRTFFLRCVGTYTVTKLFLHELLPVFCKHPAWTHLLQFSRMKQPQNKFCAAFVLTGSYLKNTSLVYLNRERQPLWRKVYVGTL